MTLWPGIGDRRATRFVEAVRRSKTLDQALTSLGIELAGERLEILNGPTRIRAQASDPPAAIAEASARLSPLVGPRYNRWARRKQGFQALIRLSEGFDGLLPFLEAFALEPPSSTELRHCSGPAQDTARDEDTVVLTLVQWTKGVEASVCYLPRVEPGIYPHTQSLGRAQAEEEERRLLYVAMTRARDELLLSRRRGHEGRSRLSERKRTRELEIREPYFLQTLPEPLVNWDRSGV